LGGIFANDTGISIGDIAVVQVLSGRVGLMGTDGIFNDIEPGTVVEYYVIHDGVQTNKAQETFTGA